MTNQKKDDQNKLPNALELEQAKAELEETRAKAALVEEAQAKAAQMEDLAKRAAADLANFRRRAEEEKMSFANFAKMDFLTQVLPIIDNFSRARSHVPEELKENEWVKGILAIEQQFEIFLQTLGITAIKTIGEKFNPHLHEAVTQVPGEPDTVIEEVEKGYMLGDKVLRPAKVKVGIES